MKTPGMILAQPKKEVSMPWMEVKPMDAKVLFILTQKTWLSEPGHSSVVLPSEQHLLLQGRVVPQLNEGVTNE